MYRLTLLAACFAVLGLTACSDGPTAYRACPADGAGQSTGCEPTIIEPGGGGGAEDSGGGSEADVGGEDGGGSIDGGGGDGGSVDGGGGSTDLGGPDACIPDCDGRQCGGDGCGGRCGQCPPSSTCSAGICVERDNEGEDCGGVIDCVVSCEDEACWGDCVSLGSPVARREFNEVLICVQERCERFADDLDRYGECQIDECGDAFEQCLGYPVGGTGDMACDELVWCMLDCGGESCQRECWGEATSAAQDQFDALLDCSDESRCEEFDSIDEWEECLMDRCPGELATCYEGAGIVCTERDRDRLDELDEETMIVLIVDCAGECREADLRRACISDCVSGAAELSSECGDCFGGFGACALSRCRDMCIEAPASDRCTECLESNCVDTLMSCVDR